MVFDAVFYRFFVEFLPRWNMGHFRAVLSILPPEVSFVFFSLPFFKTFLKGFKAGLVGLLNKIIEGI
ncbi:MAG TPA: hypothetical protein DHW81_03720 [Nitrospiraceae bacterium]|nr:hypothetical protein [Nitrospiraceae bacterium]